MNQHGISSGLGVGASTFQRLLRAPAGDKRLGAGDDDEARITPRGLSGLDLPRMLVSGHKLTPHTSVKATTFGEDIVLNANPGDACSFVLGYGTHHIDGVAEAIVAVSDNRDANRIAHAPHSVESLTHSQDVSVR